MDANGYVPKWAFVQRLQEVGGWQKDKRTRDSVPRNADKVRPDEIIDWWADPLSCDLAGIDDGTSPFYSVPQTIHGEKRRALSNVAIVGPPKENDRIKKILAKCFTAKELNLITQGSSFFIIIENHLDDCTGYYLRKQYGVTVPQIVLEEGTTADGIVHEVIHHLKVIDHRTAFPTDSNGTMSPVFYRLSKSERDDIVRREEIETVAETVVRTEVDDCPSGYYDDIPGVKPRKAYLHDQKEFSNCKSLKGIAATKALNEHLAQSSIIKAVITANRKGKR